MQEDLADLGLQNALQVLGIDTVILRQELCHPCGMLCQRFRLREILAGQNCRLQILQLLPEPRREHRQSHYLNETDVFLLDVVKLRMGMEHAQRMLLCGDVVPQHEIQLEMLPPLPGDGGNGGMRYALGLREDEGTLVRVASPLRENPVCQLRDPLCVRAGKTDHRHGPLHHTGRHVLIARHREASLHRRLGHGEIIVSALEVLMGQDGAAHDGQVRIGTHKVMREHRHKIKELPEGRPVDLHGRMRRIQDDAVLVVIHIG